MKSRTLPVLSVTFFLVLTQAAVADWLEVRRGANIRAESNIGADVVVHVDAGERLALVAEAQENGYYHVRTTSGQTGWIYRSLVMRRPGELGGDTESATAATSGKLEVYILNVGQADAILIRCPHGNHELLIDAADTRYPSSGRDFKARMGSLQSDDNTIEVVIASHPHADHIGNMDWVLDTYSVDLYVDNGTVYDSATYDRVERSWKKNGAGYWSAQDELVPDVDFCDRADVDARILRPAHFGEEKNPNDNSVVVRVDYGETSFLFVGDAEEEEESLLLEDFDTRALLDCDFLKVGHHGSDTSSTAAFLDAVSPKVAAISCGAKGVGTNSSYKHPRLSTVSAVTSRVGPREGGSRQLDAFDSDKGTWKKSRLDKAVYVTVVDGELIFDSDGHAIHRR
jgi:beta-lactamase superfamily II metal-dependent hydrolase